MRFANIVPIAFLRKYGTLTDYHLALAHLVLDGADPDYRHFMRGRAERGDFVILDNSLIELGYAMTIPQMIEAANSCRASEIVLPDTFMDANNTIALIKEAVKELKANYMPHGWKAQLPFRLMAVVQGEDIQTWFDCLDEVLNIDNCIGTIGIPKNTSTFFIQTDIGRTQLLQELEDKGYPTKYPWVQWHMLGSWNNPVEINIASRHHWIRGCDTSIAWACAQIGLAFDDRVGMHIHRPKEAVIDFLTTEDRFPMITAHNMITLLGWAK